MCLFNLLQLDIKAFSLIMEPQQFGRMLISATALPVVWEWFIPGVTSISLGIVTFRISTPIHAKEDLLPCYISLFCVQAMYPCFVFGALHLGSRVLFMLIKRITS